MSNITTITTATRTIEVTKANLEALYKQAQDDLNTEIAMDGLKEFLAANPHAFEVAKMIKKENGKWVLYNKAGTKVLGTHDTWMKAMAQERAIAGKTKK